MSDNASPLVDLKKSGIIVLITGLFHVFMTVVLRDFVPTESALWQWFWAFFTAIPMTGTFFMAANMFTMVLVDQLRRSKASS